jgi:heme A synthase
MIVLLALQITLGGATIVSGRAVLPTTAHVAVGAALLATSLALTLRAYRLIDGRLVEQDGPALSALRAPASALRQRVTA